MCSQHHKSCDYDVGKLKSEHNTEWFSPRIRDGLNGVKRSHRNQDWSSSECPQFSLCYNISELKHFFETLEKLSLQYGDCQLEPRHLYRKHQIPAATTSSPSKLQGKQRTRSERSQLERVGESSPCNDYLVGWKRDVRQGACQITDMCPLSCSAQCCTPHRSDGSSHKSELQL